MRLVSYLYVSLTLFVVSGCASTTPEAVLKSRGSHAATLSVREHVFASQPLWESSKYKPRKPAAATVTLANLKSIAPGLAALRAQAQGQTPEPFTIEGLTGRKVTIRADQLLPRALTQTKVMTVFIDAIAAQVLGEYQLTHGPQVNAETKKLIDRTLTFQDFWEFRAEVAKTSVAVFQDTPDAQGRRPDSLACPADGYVPWQCLFLGYFLNYYNGKFVDRDGGVLSKPKIGFVVTNETITGLTTAALEAVYDWVVVTNRLKVPVVYAGKLTDKDPGWQTAKNAAPTFATVLLSMQPQPRDVKPFVEPLSDGSKEGISKLKLCNIRLVSGLAADSAQSLSGAIVRLFGGAEVGPFVVFGKFSFGDNETIAKLIDTFVEVTSRRLTAGAASQLVYDVADNELPGLAQGMKFLADCK